MKRTQISIVPLAAAGAVLSLAAGIGFWPSSAQAQTAATAPASLSATSVSPVTPAASGSSAASTIPATSTTQPLGCIIEPEKQAEVGSPLTGVVDSVLVDRGAPIKKGQILAMMRAEVERANVESARSRAGADAEILAASANRDVAKIKMKRTYELGKLGFASGLEVDQAKGEFEVADQRLAQTRESKQIAERELSGAQAQLRQRTVRAPFDGVVIDRLVQPGERVDGKPMFRIAALNPLRVEVIIPSSYYGHIREGMTMPVQPEFAGAGSVSSQVVQVDRLVDAASGTFRARLTMPNPKREVPAGVRCKLALNGNTPNSPTSGAPAAASQPSVSSTSLPPEPISAAQMNLKAEAPRIDLPKALAKR
jgi:membrane fusion protein, heavy metal efflux system